ncbi:AAA family ATPase [Actinomycetes bacterium KLBMP 9797]
MRHEIDSITEPPAEVEIIGRETELATVLDLVPPSPVVGQVLTLLGDPGIGKTTLLEAAVHRAEAHGWRVLRAGGSERETDLAFAGLHQLLGPALLRAPRLPQRQRAALLGAIGLDGDAAPVPLVIGAAALTLLSELADERPLLVVLDDAQWIDQGSLDALAYAARRLDTAPILVLAAARGGAAPAGFERFPALNVGPLDREAAGKLLDQQARPPTGRARQRVLDQAEGNPLAIVELARTVDDSDIAGCPLNVLPLTKRLEQIFAGHVAELPERTQRLLLLAAAADGGDPDTVLAAAPDADLTDWAPAERAGLVWLVGPAVRFRHPLVRSGIYHAAPMAARRAAHLALAETLRDRPDQRAWHLAAATTGPDESAAAALEATADRARRRGGYVAAARVLEWAARISPRRADRARRLALAADAATFAGQAEWVQELAGQAAADTDDPRVRALADNSAGWAMAQTTRHRAALDMLMRIVESGSEVAPVALVNAALVVYHAGDDARRRLVDAAATRIGLPVGSPWRAWVRAVTDPFGDQPEQAAALVQMTGEGDGQVLGLIGAAAWTLDETAHAATMLAAAIEARRADGSLGSAGWTYLCLGSAYLDLGRWSEAQVAAAAAGALAAEGRLPLVAATAGVLEAELCAARGDADGARAAATAALATIEPDESRAIAAQARRSLGDAAAAEGDHEAAYDQYRMLFAASGAPLHYHSSCYAVAALAAAGARTGQRADAQRIVHRVAAFVGPTASPRVQHLLARAHGLLAEPDEAERHFAAVLSDRTSLRWPFERAQAEFEYAQLVRRHRRRTADARGYLVAATETFRRLGARAWDRRAQAEMRAAGLSVTDAEPDAFGELTPQQQQIIRLAAQGLTNREIAERLFVSPRTVATHLYRSFPKLGVTARAQLRDILPASLDAVEP